MPGRPLQHRQRGIVLPQREQSRQRDTQGPTEDRAIAAAVRDDGDPCPSWAVTMSSKADQDRAAT